MEDTLIEAKETHCILFHVDQQICAIPISVVKEVLRNAKTEQLPKQPKFSDGILDLRGLLIPIIDLRRRFLLPVIENHLDQRIIAVHLNNSVVGLKVDSIINVEKLELKPDLNDYLDKIYIKQHFIESMGLYRDELVVSIDVNELFSEIEIELFDTVKQAK